MPMHTDLYQISLANIIQDRKRGFLSGIRSDMVLLHDNERTSAAAKKHKKTVSREVLLPCWFTNDNPFKA